MSNNKTLSRACIFVLISILFFLSFDVAQSATWKPEKKFLIVGGGRGTFEIMGAKIADVITRDLEGVMGSVIPGGSDLTCRNIQKGAADLGLSISTTANDAYYGKGHFKKPFDKLRLVMSLYPGYLQFFVTKKSDIRDFTDLIKNPYKVYTGQIGTVHDVYIRAVFKAHGISKEKIKARGGSTNPAAYGDLVRMIQDGLTVFGMCTGPAPYSYMMQVEHRPGIRLLKLSEEARESMIEQIPGLFKTVIPKGKYKDQNEEIPTVAYMTQIVCSKNLSEEMVYSVCKVIYKNLPDYPTLFAGADSIKLESMLKAMAFQIHPGAKKFYLEQGLKVD